MAVHMEMSLHQLEFIRNFNKRLSVYEAGASRALVVMGYDKDGKEYDMVKNSIPNATDDLLTTIEDYGKFLVSIQYREGLTQEVYKEMTSNQCCSLVYLSWQNWALRWERKWNRVSFKD